MREPQRLIYLDSAATTLQKPPQVGRAMLYALHTMASPGRGGHAPAMHAADTAFRCRTEIAELLGVGEPERVVFTMNATHALNIAIAGLVGPGDRVVVSGYEHNAVTRALLLHGADMDVAASPLFEPEAAVEAFRRRLPGARAAVLCHVSNVYGYLLPLDEIAALCRECGVPLILDASQSAGCVDIDFDALGAAFAAMPGHKGLLGPQGTGVLLCREAAAPLMAGGTGSESRSGEMPAYLPDRLEPGTHNIPGIAGLLEGVRWVKGRTPAAILRHEQALLHTLIPRLETISGLELFVSPRPETQTGVLSLRVENADCEAVAAALGRENVAVRAGCHCAPLAHRSGGTEPTGTVRLSLSPFNTPAEMRAAAQKLALVCKKFLK